MNKQLSLVFFIAMVCTTHAAFHDTVPPGTVRPNHHPLRSRAHASFLEAVRQNDIKSAKRHYKKKKEVIFQTDENGLSALHLAQSEEMAEWLIRKDSSFLFNKGPRERLPIHAAAQHSNIPLLRVILRQKPSNGIDQPDQENNTPLHIAVLYGSYHAAKLLLDYGSNRWQRNSYNKIPADYIDLSHNKQDLKTLFR